MPADTAFWQCRDLRLGLHRTLIMGILNVTPDSFYDGGRYADVEQAVASGLRMIEEGADILDIGGESTRPGARPASAPEELDRILPVVSALRRQSSVPLSVDTYKAAVARQALAEGACIVNDISGLTFDQEMAAVVADAGAGLVIMHIKGRPLDMQRDPHYHELMAEIKEFLLLQKAYALSAGLAEAQIVVDPGLGFGKRLEDNYTILRELRQLQIGSPILIGPSRKSFIGKTLDLAVTERLEGTAAAVTAAVLNGAAIVRVHDVAAMKRVALVADAIRRS